MRQPGRRRPLLLALLLSASLHALGILTVPAHQAQSRPSAPAPIEVALLRPEPPTPPEPPRPEVALPRQIVAPPDTVNERPPDRPRFESDRDNVVLRESVRPGVPKPAPPLPPRQAEPAKRAAPRQERPRPETAEVDAESGRSPTQAERQRKSVPALRDLFASTDEIVRAQRAQEEAAKSDDGKRREARQRLALAPPPLTPEWALPGVRGTLDHLPDIQRGDVTLLNTKANAFAPFVRRVGERVFQHLVIRQRRLQLEEILSADQPVRMRVLLNGRGKLKSVRVESPSGSSSMDDTLSAALNTGAFDNNPPPSAANGSGDYEFLFQAQLRAFHPGPGGMPGRIESRLSVALL